jgi:hypothetical protein
MWPRRMQWEGASSRKKSASCRTRVRADANFGSVDFGALCVKLLLVTGKRGRRTRDMGRGGPLRPVYNKWETCTRTKAFHGEGSL